MPNQQSCDTALSLMNGNQELDTTTTTDEDTSSPTSEEEVSPGASTRNICTAYADVAYLRISA
jgi:hypothetical protein